MLNFIRLVVMLMTLTTGALSCYVIYDSLFFMNGFNPVYAVFVAALIVNFKPLRSIADA